MRIPQPAHWIGVCWLVAAMFAQDASSQAIYAGTWVMKLGDRNFVVLTLRNEEDKLAGSLSRPNHFQTGDGISYSHFANSVTTEPIASVTVEKASLRLVVGNDREEYDMALTGDRASLKPVGFPFEGWTLKRFNSKDRPVVSTDWDPERSYSTGDDQPKTSSAEMRRIYEEDQAPRQDIGKLTPEKWATVGKQDAERQNLTRKLLADGQLHTAEDFTKAAFIFQHGSTPEDYLLAHTLATVAVSKGDESAIWIATATLDRYLQSVGKPQIYGTQFKTAAEGATQEPYNRDLISDSLRRQLRIPTLPAQQEQLKYWRDQFKASAPKAK